VGALLGVALIDKAVMAEDTSASAILSGSSTAVPEQTIQQVLSQQ